jgi:hypothetical protein
LSNKRDLPNTVPLDDIRVMCAKVTMGVRHGVFYISVKQGLVDGGIQEAMDWFAPALRTVKAPFDMEKASAPKPLANPSTLERKVEEWLARAETDTTPEELLENLNDCRLPSWDHYTHVRMVYTILIVYGRRKGTCSWTNKA